MGYVVLADSYLGFAAAACQFGFVYLFTDVICVGGALSAFPQVALYLAL